MKKFIAALMAAVMFAVGQAMPVGKGNDIQPVRAEDRVEMTKGAGQVLPDGDANEDGDVNINDVLLIQQFIAQWDVILK